MKKSKIAILGALIAALTLEILPYGAVCNFAVNEGRSIKRVTYSYFNPLPYGYANFGPLITAMLTCVLLVLACICLFKASPKLEKSVKCLSCIAFITSLMPLMFGINYFSVVGALISVCLLAVGVLQFVKIK